MLHSVTRVPPKQLTGYDIVVMVSVFGLIGRHQGISTHLVVMDSGGKLVELQLDSSHPGDRVHIGQILELVGQVPGRDLCDPALYGFQQGIMHPGGTRIVPAELSCIGKDIT